MPSQTTCRRVRMVTVAEGIVLVSDANYQQTVIGSPLPILIGFGARWSGAWHALEPALQVIAQKFAGRLRVASVDCDSNWEVVKTWSVFSYPCLILLRVAEGQVTEVARRVGPRTAREILNLVESVVGERRDNDVV